MLPTRGVTHGFTPEPLLEVVNEQLAVGVLRSGQVDASVPQLFNVEIGDGVEVLPLGREGKQADGQN